MDRLDLISNYCLSACKDGCDLVISIGGDGTLHETINGMMDQDHRPRLGVIHVPVDVRVHSVAEVMLVEVIYIFGIVP